MLLVANVRERISSVLRTGALACLLAMSAPAQTTAQEAMKTAQCASLAGVSIAAKEFALPTGGAQVAEAKPMDVGGAAYCRVSGSIAPATQGAPQINYQVNLPANWNGKAVQYGGGGYNGNSPNAAGRTTSGLRDAPVPLAQGYMTFADDSADLRNAAFLAGSMLNCAAAPTTTTMSAATVVNPNCRQPEPNSPSHGLAENAQAIP